MQYATATPKIVLCYIVVTHGNLTEDFCARFVATYHEHPPGREHDTLIICNGGPLDTATASMFSSLPNCQFYPRTNDQGYDISAYVDAANGPAKDYEAMLCLGESVHFWRAGWLTRLVYAWEKFGPGMYGPFSSHAVMAHLNTTAFFTSPILLREYPHRVKDRASRYVFEHRENSFWRWASKRGHPAMLVTWDGIWPPRQWRAPANILWRGDQSNLLFDCNHSERYASVPESTKRNWERSCDRAFK